jgi:hypothetical protein
MQEVQRADETANHLLFDREYFTNLMLRFSINGSLNLMNFVRTI